MLVRLFSPAVTLINRLRYLSKFILIGAVLVVPTLILLSQFLVRSNDDINFSRSEQIGIRYNEPVFDLLSDTPRISLADLDAYITAVDAIEAELGTTLGVSESWQQIKARAQALRFSASRLNPVETVTSRTNFSNELQHFITEVGNNSGLILDPDIDTYYLMDTTITKLPQLTSFLNQIRAYGAAAIRGELTTTEEARITILSGFTTSTLDLSLLGYNYAYNINLDVRAELEAYVQVQAAAINEFLDLVETDVIQAGRSAAGISIDLPTYYAAVDSAIDATTILYDRASNLLDELLQRRIDGLAQARSGVIAVSLIALGAAVYLFAGFYLSVQGTIRRLDRTSQELVDGQPRENLVLPNRDELAQIALAFNNVGRALITERDRAIEANRLKDEFLATISHELRTPLNSIIGYVDLMRMGIRGKVDEDGQEILKRVSESSVNLLKLINDVLDIAKIEAGRLDIVSEPFEVRAMIDQWRRQMDVTARQKQITFEVNVDPSLPEEVMGDEERITQVGLNLLSNAFKFTEKGKVSLDVDAHKDTWTIRVTDTGIGIPPHALEYIFDEFRQVDGSNQRAYGGTGLGLAITRKLCAMMDGKVQVQSRVDEGSSFTVTLPLSAAVVGESVLNRSEEYVS